MYEIDAFMIKLKHETLKIRISETLSQVCHTDHLRKYVFSPPKMTKVLKYNLNSKNPIIWSPLLRAPEEDQG